jgi:hypothetical protein
MNRDKGVLDGYHLGEALGPVAGLLGRRCGAAAVQLLTDRLADSLGSPEDDRYSYMWRPAVEEHEQNLDMHEYRAALLKALRDSALAATSVPGDAAPAAVRLLLQAEHPTLVRVGVFVCSENFSVVRDEFWARFKPEWLSEPVYWHELYWLLRKNFTRFSAQERSGFLDLVCALQGHWRQEHDAADWDERQRRDVLHAIAGQGDDEVDSWYRTLVDRWGPVREHPDFHSYHGSSWVGERSPVSAETLLAMDDPALMEYLRAFEPRADAWDAPTRRGLAQTLSDAVRASQDGFAARLPHFLSLHRAYQHGVLSGLRYRLVEDKKPANWPALLEFLKGLVAAQSFRDDLNQESKGWEPSVHWVVNDVADLLKAGAEGEQKLPPELHEAALGVLKVILNSIPAEPAGELKDPVSHTINAPRGRSLEAVVNLALAMRRARADSQDERDAVWRLVAPTFEAELAESDVGRNGEFATVAGLYCANLHFLNGTWVEREFDRLFSTRSDEAWRCAAEGFAYQRYMYQWLFRLLRDGGHLRRMIQGPEVSNHVREKALQFLALAFLEGQEQITPHSVLGGLVAALAESQLTQLCWFFWTLRRQSSDAEGNRIRTRILEFWRHVTSAMREAGNDLPEVQSALNQLAPFLEELDEETTRLWAEAAKHANVKYHGNVLVENMARLAPRFPLQVFAVFQSALSEFLPDFDEEDVVKCVLGIAEAGHSDEAEWLCNEYANRGSSLLKKAYDSIRGRDDARGKAPRQK